LGIKIEQTSDGVARADVSTRQIQLVLDTLAANGSETPPGLLSFVAPVISAPLPANDNDDDDNHDDHDDDSVDVTATPVAKSSSSSTSSSNVDARRSPLLFGTTSDAPAPRATPSLRVSLLELNQNRTRAMVKLECAVSCVVVHLYEWRAVACDVQTLPRVLTARIDALELRLLRHSNDSFGLSLGVAALRVHDGGAFGAARAPFDCNCELLLDAAGNVAVDNHINNNDDASRHAFTLHMFKAESHDKEFHVRLSRPRLRVRPGVAFALVAHLRKLIERAADVVPRFHAHHFGAEHGGELRTVIVRLTAPRCVLLPDDATRRATSPVNDDDDDDASVTCIVLDARSASMQIKAQAQRDDGDDESVRSVFIGSCEDINIVRCGVAYFAASARAIDPADAAAIAVAQPFDMLCDVVSARCGVAYAPATTLRGAPDTWPTCRRTTTGNVSLQKSRRQADASRDTIVFAVSDADVAALASLAHSVNAGVARLQRAASVDAQLDNAELDERLTIDAAVDTTVRLRATHDVAFDVEVRDNLCVKLVADLDNNNSKSNVATADSNNVESVNQNDQTSQNFLVAAKARGVKRLSSE
jgi:hypothetical protein